MTGQRLRATLAEELPERIAAVLAAYDTFAGMVVADKAKAFAAHHTACKAALAHADLLVRLLKWAEGGVTSGAVGGTEAEGPEALLARARAALGSDDQDPDEEGGTNAATD